MSILESTAVGMELPVNGTYTCTKTTFVEHVNNAYVYVVELNNKINAVLLSSEPNLSAYLNRDVDVEFRAEVYNGINSVIISNFSILKHITALDKEEGIKLYVEDNPDNMCTINFSDIAPGTAVSDVILYCIDEKLGASSRAEWMDLTLVDRSMKSARVRIFNVEDKSGSLANKYVSLNLSRTEKYGFQSSEVTVASGLSQLPNPEVDISIKYISRVIHGLGEEWQDYFNSIRYTDNLKEFDFGKESIKVAKSLHIIQELVNVTPHVRKDLLILGILGSYLYLCDNIKNEETMSKQLRNTLMISRAKHRPAELLSLLDGDTEKCYLEKEMIKRVTDMINFLVDETKDYRFDSNILISTK